MAQNTQERIKLYNMLVDAGLNTLENQVIADSFTDKKFLLCLFYAMLKAKILNQENFNMVTRPRTVKLFPPKSSFLSRHFPKMFKPKIYGTLSGHEPNFEPIAQACSRLSHAEILTQEHFKMLIEQAHPYEFSKILTYLHETKILNDDNRSLILKYKNIVPLAAGLKRLQREEILNQDIFKSLVSHLNPDEFSKIIRDLSQSKILSTANLDLVQCHPDTDGVSLALEQLHKDKILNQETFVGIITHPNPKVFSDMMKVLNWSRLLKTENLAVLATKTLDNDRVIALNQLRLAGILNQENFNLFFAPRYSVLLAPWTIDRLWYRLSTESLRRHWPRILSAASGSHPLRALETLVNQILGIDAPEASAYNPAQSTHTASVHRTISVSAEKLMFSYGHLNLETKLAQLEVEIRALEDSSFKIMAAKRALSRLIARDYLFTDSSGVSTRQLLGLVYCAILDNTKRKGSLLDAKKLLIDALYEIQRGYNLNAAGVDDNQSDRPICVAGTFNKLVSILMGIHPDVELRYVTTTAAAAKLPIVVQRHLLNYLKSLASSVNTQTKCLDVMKTIQADGHLESIWKELIKGVEAEIWDEFKEAYQENRTHRDFLDLLANGVWSPLPDLKVIDDKLKPALQTATGLFASSAVSEQKEELKPSLSIA